MTEPETSPTPASELVAAVAHVIEHVLLPSVSGREAFQARVAVRALGVVGRELSSSPHQLTDLDGSVVTRDELATSIRQGDLGATDPALRELLARDALVRIGVDSPDYPTVREARLTWPGLR